jgi:hypothetical protein
MAIKSMLDAPILKDTGIKKEDFWSKALSTADKFAKPALDIASAPFQALGHASDWATKQKIIGMPGDGLPDYSLQDIGGAAAGAFGGLVGGAVGTAGSMLTGQAPGPEAWKNISKTASETAQFGEEVGREGVAQAPAALLTEGATKYAGSKLGVGEQGPITTKTEEIAKNISEKKKIENATELSRPIIGAKKQPEAIKYQGVEKQTAFKEARLKPTARDLERGKIVSEILDPDELKTPTPSALEKLRNANTQKAETLKNTLTDVTYDPQVLFKKVNDYTPSSGVKGSIAKKALRDIKATFLESLSDTNSASASEILQARKMTDSEIRQLLPNNYQGPVTPFKTAISDLRKMFNEHAAESYAKSVASDAAKRNVSASQVIKIQEIAKQSFLDSLNEQSLLHEAETNIAKKLATGKKGAGISGPQFKTGKVQEIAKKLKKPAIATGVVLGASAGVKKGIDILGL